MNQDNLIFILAMALFATAAARLVYLGALFSPQFLVAMTMLLMGVLNLAPQMVFSAGRAYVLSTTTQVFVAIAAATFLGSAWFIERGELADEYPRVRWKFLSRRGWLVLFCMVCVADPCISYLLYGKVGLVQGNQTMGAASGSGDRGDVVTPLTFFAWSAAAMAVAMLLTDFLFSFAGYAAYLKRRLPDIVLVMVSTMCTVLSGNRFVLIAQLMTVTLGLAMFARLKVWMIVAAALFLAIFFVIVGNYRFGTMNIVDSMERTTGNASADMLTAWITTYTEPNFPNLDNFLHTPPRTMYGMDWVSSILPSSVGDALGITRMNSAEYLGSNELYAYHGLTFRTMYPDLIMDFGFKGSLILGALFYTLGMFIYNRALLSPRDFVIFLVFTPLLLFSPLLAGFYNLPNLLPFGLIFLIRQPRRVRRYDEDEEDADEPSSDDAATTEAGREHEPEMAHEPEHARSLPPVGTDFSPSR